tara:strand:- start:198 stop:935 length:738 start_codon:yes stop_codon:yes gene_type:complete
MKKDKDEIDDALYELDKARTTKTGIDDKIEMKERKFYDLGGCDPLLKKLTHEQRLNIPYQGCGSEYYSILKVNRRKNEKIQELDNVKKEFLNKLESYTDNYVVNNSQRKYQKNLKKVNESYQDNYKNKLKNLKNSYNKQKIDNRLSYFYDESHNNNWIWHMLFKYLYLILLVVFIGLQYRQTKSINRISKIMLILTALLFLPINFGYFFMKDEDKINVGYEKSLLQIILRKLYNLTMGFYGLLFN